jgi:hypothetical protein
MKYVEWRKLRDMELRTLCCLYLRARFVIFLSSLQPDAVEKTVPTGTLITTHWTKWRHNTDHNPVFHRYKNKSQITAHVPPVFRAKWSIILRISLDGAETSSVTWSEEQTGALVTGVLRLMLDVRNCSYITNLVSCNSRNLILLEESAARCKRQTLFKWKGTKISLAVML